MDVDVNERYLKPTIVSSVSDEMPLMKEELFGPSDALGKNIKIKNKNFKMIIFFNSTKL